LNFYENVDLSEPIISRFDILLVLKDEVDTNNDIDLSRFVLNSHFKSHPLNKSNHNLIEEREYIDDEIEHIDIDLLRKYVNYARSKIRPKIQNIQEDNIIKIYNELRKESVLGGGISIVVRNLDSIIRISES